jgi:hypothetical protein
MFLSFVSLLDTWCPYRSSPGYVVQQRDEPGRRLRSLTPLQPRALAGLTSWMTVANASRVCAINYSRPIDAAQALLLPFPFIASNSRLLSLPKANRLNKAYEVTRKIGVAIMKAMYRLAAALYVGLEGSTRFGGTARLLCRGKDGLGAATF